MLTNKLLSLSLINTEWLVYLLLFLSVVSVAVIIERFMVLKAKNKDQGVKTKVDLLLQNGGRNLDEALRSDESAAAEVARAALHNYKGCGIDVEDSIALAVTEERLVLEKRLVILATVGANAPFLGLLGTVLGIIHAFYNLSLHIKAGPEAVMGGISEALVTTALGLFVAIPAAVAYNYFLRRIKIIMVNAENFTRIVLNRASYSGKTQG